jgi:NAD+ kinase
MKSVRKNFPNKHIAIAHRPESPEALAKAKEIADWLREVKVHVYSPSGKKLGKQVKPLESRTTIEKLDLLVVVGGDGTYLRAANLLDGQPIPILGINMGSLGFLTETRADEAYKAILNFLENKMEMHRRSIAKVTVIKGGKSRKYYFGINDVVFERGEDSHLINIGITFEKSLIAELKADGIIVATPTGSTAYNLAAGGPIIYPNSSVFSIVPINSHSLTMRPLIVPDDRQIHIKILSKNTSAFLTVDGQRVEEVKPNDQVVIEKSARDHVTVREPGNNYFDLLRDKLKFGQRA